MCLTINGNILLNPSDTIYYNAGDVRGITLSSSTPSGSGSRTSLGGGGSSVFKDPYLYVASGIKSEKIREIVHNSKIIVGSEIDEDLSAKDLKKILGLTNKSLEIKEDCIIIGGPKANQL